ncbi:hypothetical protein CHL10075_07600 [Campylobacter hyointestinalis subsp. lawsonii]|nr:hypothetical protein CHL10075_07600 [Campylobacter hyointestinalis subsp. lawsonii]
MLSSSSLRGFGFCAFCFDSPNKIYTTKDIQDIDNIHFAKSAYPMISSCFVSLRYSTTSAYMNCEMSTKNISIKISTSRFLNL